MTSAARAGLASAILMLLVNSNRPSGSVLFVLGHPVLTWVLVDCALTVSLVLYLFAAVVGAGTRPRRPPLRRLGLAVVRTVTVMAFGWAWLCSAWLTITSADDAFLTLDGGERASCDVVVQETSFLSSVSLRFFAVSSGVVLASPVENTAAADGYFPFTAGTYRVSWDGDEATIVYDTGAGRARSQWSRSQWSRSQSYGDETNETVGLTCGRWLAGSPAPGSMSP